MINYGSWVKKPVIYILSGIICMILVIWIARTAWFYVCYFPVIFFAFYLSVLSNPEKHIVLPSKKIRMFSFITGMVISELIFAMILVLRNEITFNMQISVSDWTVLAIELILCVFIFVFFFGLSIAIRFFLSKN